MCIINIHCKYIHSLLKIFFQKIIFRTICLLGSLIVLQLVLGVLTVLTEKHPHITSFHVMTGAGILGTSVLLFLRTAPLRIQEIKTKILS